MRILLINHYAGSLDMGMEFRPYYMAREWIKQGHKVHIYAASFSHLRSVNPKINRDFEIQNIDGIIYHWIKTCEYSGNGIMRAITMFQFTGKLLLNAIKIVKGFKPDIVIASSTYPLDTYPARKIAKIAKAKLIHETHDLWPLTLTELGGMSKYNPFILMLQAAENIAYKHSDAVIGLFPYAYKHMLKHGLGSKDKFRHIPNGIAVDDWIEPDAAPDDHLQVFNKEKEKGNFIVCYLGGHALSNFLDIIIETAVLTKDEPISYVLVGRGIEKKRLIERSINLKCKNIFFLPPVTKKAVPSVLALADALYLGGKQSSLYKYGVSLNKLYDYMMASKPIIYALNAANNEVEEANCGITVNPSNAKSVANAIYKLISMSDKKRKELGLNGKEAVLNNFTYTALARKFIEYMES